jgi:hypothetical protein
MILSRLRYVRPRPLLFFSRNQQMCSLKRRCASFLDILIILQAYPSLFHMVSRAISTSPSPSPLAPTSLPLAPFPAFLTHYDAQHCNPSGWKNYTNQRHSRRLQKQLLDKLTPETFPILITRMHQFPPPSLPHCPSIFQRYLRTIQLCRSNPIYLITTII